MHKLIMGALLAFAMAFAGPTLAADLKGSATQSVQVVKSEQSNTDKKHNKQGGLFFSTEIWVKNLSYYPVHVVAGGWNTYIPSGVMTCHEYLPPSSYSQHFMVYDRDGYVLFNGYVFDGEMLVIYNI
jgi:hypothetical protein